MKVGDRVLFLNGHPVNSETMKRGKPIPWWAYYRVFRWLFNWKEDLKLRKGRHGTVIEIVDHGPGFAGPIVKWDDEDGDYLVWFNEVRVLNLLEEIAMAADGQ